MKAYIHYENNKLVTSKRDHIPQNMVCECPKKQDGSYELDLSVIDVKDVWMDGLEEKVVDENTPEGASTYKKAFINDSKVQQRDQQLQSEAQDKAWEDLRRKRDDLLRQCDYIMMPDYPMSDKSEWESYRQELRDLPANTQDPNNPSFPSKPN